MSTSTATEQEPSSSRLPLLRAVAPHLPSMLLRTTQYVLSLTPQSEYWDLRTTLTVEFLRSYMTSASAKPTTVEATQALANKPQKVPANTWAVPVTLSGPGSKEEARAIEGAVVEAVVSTGGKREYILPTNAQGLTAEWIGNRRRKERGYGHEEKKWSAEKKYQAMMEEVEGGEDAGAVLYLHGGAYFVCDPCTHRLIVRQLAKQIRGRCLLIRYRLAPQHAFPAALLDALISYLTLLYPPPGSFHSAIPASRVTFCGDSAGGGLVLSLLQLLLTFQRNHTTIPWHGRTVSVPLPAGVAGFSPWVDLSRCFPSEESCTVYDYLPTPSSSARTKYLDSPAWSDEVRQGGGGRKQFYAPDGLLTNPLVSPLAAPLDAWKGSCPVWLSVGDECLRDSGLFLAKRLREEGVPLVLEKVIAMPHVFLGMFMHLEASRRAWRSLAEFILHVTSAGERGAASEPSNEHKSENENGTGAGEQTEGTERKKAQERQKDKQSRVHWGALEIHPTKMTVRELSDDELSMGFTFEQVLEMMRVAVEQYGREAEKGPAKRSGREVAEAVHGAQEMAKI